MSILRSLFITFITFICNIYQIIISSYTNDTRLYNCHNTTSPQSCRIRQGTLLNYINVSFLIMRTHTAWTRTQTQSHSSTRTYSVTFTLLHPHTHIYTLIYTLTHLHTHTHQHKRAHKIMVHISMLVYCLPAEDEEYRLRQHRNVLALTSPDTCQGRGEKDVFVGDICVVLLSV